MIVSFNGQVVDLFKKPTTVDELKTFNHALRAIVHHVLGPRSSAIVMIGMPIPDVEHDRFSAAYYGPCLSARGLLVWGTRSVESQMDDDDTSKNGKPHP